MLVEQATQKLITLLSACVQNQRPLIDILTRRVQATKEYAVVQTLENYVFISEQAKRLKIHALRKLPTFETPHEVYLYYQALQEAVAEFERMHKSSQQKMQENPQQPMDILNVAEYKIVLTSIQQQIVDWVRDFAPWVESQALAKVAIPNWTDFHQVLQCLAALQRLPMDTTRHLSSQEGHQYAQGKLSVAVGGGEVVVSFSDVRKVKVWELRHLARSPKIYEDPENGSLDVAVVRQFVVSQASDHLLKVWGRSRTRPHRLIRLADKIIGMTAVDGFVLVGTMRGELEMYDADTGRCVRKLPILDDRLSCVAAGSGKIAAVCGGALNVRDLDSGEALLRTTIQTGQGNAMCLATDGEIVAVGTSTGQIEAWEIMGKRRLYTIQAHTAAVTCLAIEGERLISGSNDGSLRIRGLRTGTLVETLTDHHGAITSIAAGDGYLASASRDRTFCVYQLPTRRSIDGIPLIESLKESCDIIRLHR